jgi:transcriptional regulator with XRE-family HTH domain
LLRDLGKCPTVTGVSEAARVAIPAGYRERKAAVERDVRRSIGQVVKMRLVGLGMRQVELARRIGMTEGDLSRKVNGSRSWSEAELLLVAEALRLDVADLFTDPTQMVQSSSTPPGTRTQNRQISAEWAVIHGADRQLRLPGRWPAGRRGVNLRAADADTSA